MQTEILRSAQDDMFMLADVTNIRASDDIRFGVLAVMSLAWEQTARTSPAHLAADPPEHGMELHIGAFSTISCHTNLLETI
jgi:hypothetical protein